MNLHEKLQETKSFLLSSKKERIFGISTTNHIANPNVIFSTPKEIQDIVFANVILSSDESLPTIVKELDGFVDYFFVDCENKNKLQNLECKVRELARKSPVVAYKPNDFTVAALEQLITNLIPNLNKIPVAIAGFGNIGSKIALTLSERGAEVRAWSRNFSKTKQITEALQLIKRGMGTISAFSSLEEATQGAQVILGVTSGIAVLTEEMLKNTAKDAIVIDVGNGTLTKEAISLGRQMNLHLLTLFPQGGLEGFITNWRFYKNYVGNLETSHQLGKHRLITPGSLGEYGDILVDNLKNPKKIFGICDGKGNLLPEQEALPLVEAFKNEVFVK